MSGGGPAATDSVGWWERPLAVTLIGVAATGAITAAAASVAAGLAQSRWMERADARATALERRADSTERLAEALDAKDADTAARVVALETDSRNDRRILLRLEEKVDQLLQRRFGAAE